MPSPVRGNLVIIRGEQFPLPFTIRNLRGLSLIRAWLTVKKELLDDDGVTGFQCAITSTLGAGGQIEDDGSANGIASGFFAVMESQTMSLNPDDHYYYDVKAQFDTGEIRYFEKGEFVAEERVTQAS